MLPPAKHHVNAPALSLFLPVADVAGRSPIVIAPTPVDRPPRQDSREEQRRDDILAAVLPPASKEKTNGKSKKPSPASSWPALPRETNFLHPEKPPIKSNTRKPTNTHALLQDQHRIYGGSGRLHDHNAPAATTTNSSNPLKKKGKRMLPPQARPSSLVSLDPLDATNTRQLQHVTEQQHAIVRAMDNRIDHVSRGLLPLQFLVQHEKTHGFAKRVVLVSMCRVLDRHYARVATLAFHKWKKQTIVKHLLEAQARQLFLLRQTSLAHACAIIQRHVHTRMRLFLIRWHHTSGEIRFSEQQRAAQKIQKWVRKYQLLDKFQKLAILYRHHVRHVSAICIQSAVRRFLAQCELRRVVYAHHRHVAACRIQQTYRQYLMVQIAKRNRHQVTATTIQRVWRGFVGRKRVEHRRRVCRGAVEEMVVGMWTPHALVGTKKKHDCAAQIQNCWHAFLLRQQIATGICELQRRRKFFPAFKFQRTWRRYRAYQLESLANSLVFRVLMTHLCAARRIQHCFRMYWAAKKDHASRRLVAVFRMFAAKRLVVQSKIVPLLRKWQTQFLEKFIVVCDDSSSVWRPHVHAWQKRLDEFHDDQRSCLRRLNVRNGLRVAHEWKQFNHLFREAHASDLQRVWRWFALRRLVQRLRNATILLQRALPILYRQFTRRRLRQRVLQRWKRQQFIQKRDHFDHWKRLFLLRRQARDLTTTTHKLRKALWFHHHKLRKRMTHQWWTYVLHQRSKAAKMETAITFHAKVMTRSHWRGWREDVLPGLCCANRLNELIRVLTVWETWRKFVIRKMKSKKARHHCQVHAKCVAILVWKQDRIDFHHELWVAQTLRDGHLSKHVVHALKNHVNKMKQVRAFCRQKQQLYALRHWLERLYDTKKDQARNAQAQTLRHKQLKRTFWRQWAAYIHHQRCQAGKLREMERYYTNHRLHKTVATWSKELVPLWRDMRVTTSMATLYRSRRLQEHVFRHGFAKFWALTAGARRISMAIRIQKLYRRSRARQRLFVLKMQVKYQLETRATMGLDSKIFTADTLRDALVDKAHEWVFALFSFPWAPLDARTKEVFCKTATTFTFIRPQNMAFGLVDATGNLTFSSSSSSWEEDENQAPTTTTFSLMSWFGLTPSQLPCVVGFWQGIGTSSPQDNCKSRLVTGDVRVLKRRFKTVCSTASNSDVVAETARTTRLQLVYPCCASAPSMGFSLSRLVHWIDSLRDHAHDATAVDLQSYVRGFLTRRHLKRHRIIRKHRQAQRIRDWVFKLKQKWTHTKREVAASFLQKWVRGVFARCAYWYALRREMRCAKEAATRLQWWIRGLSDRNRLRAALVSLLATCDKYPNAPLCQECCCFLPRGDAAGGESRPVGFPSFQLARLRCRDCQCAFCGPCFAKTHKSGKRMLHLCDSIEIAAMENPTSVMCLTCEVRGATRRCGTCPHGTTLACTSCFESQHTDKRTKKKEKQTPWWASLAFQQHAWHRMLPPKSGQPIEVIDNQQLTARHVMEKYGWQNKNVALATQQHALEAAETLRERDEKLLAIRLQSEAILRDAFDRFDKDKSGSIDRQEFHRMFTEELCEPLSDTQVESAMAAMDKSGNGQIEFDELLAWFAQDTLDKQQASGDGAAMAEDRSLDKLKESLKAKRKMRRYKEKLYEFVPSVSFKQLPLAKALTQQHLQEGTTDTTTTNTAKRKQATVPGFPSVNCLEHGDFAAKRKVFFRFVDEICGFPWIHEDESKIPLVDAMEIFDKVFLPRWNKGELTFDYYFDDQQFEFEGELWQRKWDPQSKKYLFTTTRRMMKKKQVEVTIHEKKQTKRNQKTKRKTSNAAVDAIQTEETEEKEEEGQMVEIVEAIDPRRKKMLLDDAQQAFTKADTDGSGWIDEMEFHRMLTRELCEPISKKTSRQIMRTLDADGSGKIDFHEFFQWYAVEKCQEYPLTAQMERTKALLKTQKRAKETLGKAVQASVASAVHMKQAIAARRKEQQLASDCKGASKELIELLQEGHDKLLAEKALALHNQDVAFARHWLERKKQEEQRERDELEKQKHDQNALKKKTKRHKQQKRNQQMVKIKQTLKLILIGPSKKELHAARLQQALTNLDRELMQVERQLTTK